MSSRTCIGVLLAGALVVCGQAFSYEPAAPPAAAPFRVLSTEQTRPGEVIIHLQTAEAALSEGNLTLRLGKSGAALSPAHFASTPITADQAALLICIDRSGSMGVTGVNAVLTALRQTLVPQGDAARLPFLVNVLAFASDTQHLTKGFTADPAQIQAALQNVRVEPGRNGRTHLNDAIVGGLAELRPYSAQFRRLIVISDGNDEGSEVTSSAMLEQVSAANPIQVDAVALGRLAADAAGSLMLASGASGGEFSYVDTQPALTGAVAHLVRQFAAGDRYEARFDFAPAPDGHTVDEPVLIYQGKTLPLRAAITAMAPPVPPDPVPVEPWWKKLLRVLVKVALDIRVEIALGAATAVGAGAAVADERVRRKVRRFVMIYILHHSTDNSNSGQSGGAKKPKPGPSPSPRKRTEVIHSWPAADRGRAVASFEGRTGPVNGKRWLMSRPTFNVGSSGDNDLVLESDDYISSHHAVIKAEGSGLHITDLGSRNGTRVNGEPLAGTGRPLLPGDQIELGHTVLEVGTA